MPGTGQSSPTMCLVPDTTPSARNLPPGDPQSPARPGPPLQLGRVMRVRLLTAVRALLDDSRFTGHKDVVRLGGLVLLAKASLVNCRVELTARELARWLGVSESTVDHEVLSVLREVDAVVSRVLRGKDGRPTGVEYRVEPLWEARGKAGDPLALSKSELATLLRFLEGLFAPGWGEQCATPAGLLAERRGRGAASDRLALVLLALHSRPDGRVPLVGGPLAKKVARHGRAAVTLARMLGCGVPTAATVLERLRAVGAVTGGLDRLRLPAVALAHKLAVAGKGPTTVAARDQASRPSGQVSSMGTDFCEPSKDGLGRAVPCARCSEQDGSQDAFPMDGEGWQQMSSADQPPEAVAETAPRDLNEAETALSAGQKAFLTKDADSCAAELHAYHAPVAEVCGESAHDLWFSGEAASGYCRRPERTCARKSSPERAPQERRLTAVAGQTRPLRGDNPHLSSSTEQFRSSAAVMSLEAWRSASSGPPLVSTQVPKSLERVLEPIAMVWGHLGRMSTRWFVIKAVRAQLNKIAGVCGPDVDAEWILRERLKQRLSAQGRVPIKDPVGWLVSRGLPRRSVCPDVRCDDGRRMDTQADCQACRLLILDSQALRARALETCRAGLDHQMRVSRSLFETHLNGIWQTEVTSASVRREQDARVRQTREADRAKQKAARRSMPCTICGQLEAAGLCTNCREGRRVERLVAEAVDVTVATWGVGGGLDEQRGIAELAEQDVRGVIEEAVAELSGTGAEVFAETIALSARLAAESKLEAVRQTALNYLAQSPEARAESRRVYATQMGRQYLYASEDEAREAAEEEAVAARWRTAHCLLDQRLGELRAERAWVAGQSAQSGQDPYAEAAARVRALIRSALPEQAQASRRRAGRSMGNVDLGGAGV